MTPTRPPLPLLEVADRAALRAWLEANHASSPGVRLVLGKKGSTATALRYEDAIEEALAFGWIDSRGTRLDEERYLVQLSPRRRGGNWSRSNKLRIERLMAEGRMAPAGLAVIETAKADGSWERLDAIEDMVMPPDFSAALAEEPEAAAFWETMSPSQRKMALYWIGSAKRTETRERRIAETVRAASKRRRVP